MEGQRWPAVHLLLLFLLLGAAASYPSKDDFRFLSEEADVDTAQKWQLVTRDNFTDHIGKHEYSLCIARVPWCGEARSLMNGILRLLKAEPAIFPKLSLCSVNSDKDKRLSDSFFGGRSPSFTFFRQSSAFKYNGRLSSHHVVASVRYAMATPPEELVFKHVNSSEQLHALIRTTDIAVVLIDRCGWAKAQPTPEWGSDFQCSAKVGSSGGYTSSCRKKKLALVGQTDCYLGGCQSSYPGSNTRPQQCHVQRTTWWSEEILGCTLANLKGFQEVFRNLSRLAAAHVMTPHRVKFALVTEGQVAIGAGFHGVQGQPWLLAAKVHDFHRTPHFYTGKGDIEEFLSSLSPLVHELEAEVGDSGPVFWNETPSVVLFIDRASASHAIQEKSNAALNVLRAVARHYDAMGLTYGSTFVMGTPSVVNDQEENVVTALKHPSVPVESEEEGGRLTLSMAKEGVGDHPTSRKEEVLDLGDLKESLKGDRISLSLLDQVRVVLGTLDVSEALSSRIAVVQFDSGLENRMLLDSAPVQLVKGLNDITDRFLGADKAETKFVRHVEGCKAKDGRIMLCSSRPTELSSRVDGCVEGAQRSLPNSLSDSFDGKGTSVAVDGFVERDKVLIAQEDAGAEEVLQDSLLNGRGQGWSPAGDSCTSVAYYDQMMGGSGRSPDKQGPIVTWEAVGKQEILSGDGMVLPKYVETEDRALRPDILGKGVNETLAFVFWDGETEVQQKLTTSVVSPSLVVLHPERVAHYVYPLDLAITKASVIEFLDLILYDKLQKTTLSEPDPLPPREQPQPPLLNLDFHETDAVPRVTVNSFEKLVLGFEELRARCGRFVCVHDKDATVDEGTSPLVPNGQPWEKDVVVLFTTSWCGFCKRMELVFKEVHRAIRRYLLLADTVSERLGTTTELVTKIMYSSTGPGLPTLLQMDCVLNDCSERLKHVLQEEIYPTVILFPSSKKSSPVVYHGAVTVSGLISFLLAHGTASVNLQHLLHGVVRSKPEESPDRVSTSEQLDLSSREHHLFQMVFPPAKGGQMLDTGSYIVKSSGLDADWERSAKAETFPSFPEMGGFLVATENLVSSVFESSVILVVSANAQSVWGVMINKPLLWENLVGLDIDHQRVLSDCPLNYGGPSAAQGKPFFVMTHTQQLQGFNELSPDIFFGGTVVSADEVSGWIKSGVVVAKDVWLFVGTAVWGWSQLQEEIDGGFWQLVSPKDGFVQWPL